MSSGAAWVAKRLETSKLVVSANAVGDRINVSRESRPAVSIGVLSVPDVRVSDVLPFTSDADPIEFVLNIPRQGRFLGATITHLDEEQVGWGGMADAFRALRDHNSLGDYEERELKFVFRGLRQHRRVEDVILLDDHRFRVVRRELSDIVIFMGAAYQPTAESVRDAVDRYGEFDIFAATNPNSNPTAEAVQVATDSGFRMLKWAETLAALHE